MTSLGDYLGSRPNSDRFDADLLATHVLGVTRSFLYTHPEQRLSPDQVELLESLLARRDAGTPVAYLTGVREFWSLEFEVDPAVLIPRPETELLVEAARDLLRPGDRLLDLGTGSGAIAVAIAHERPDCEVLASDLSRAALAIAERNANRHGCDVTFQHSDWFDAIQQQFAMIVANPPYVAEDDPYLCEASRNHEPRAALLAGADGLDALRRLIGDAPQYLSEQGWLLVEHGWTQGEAVRALFDAAGFEALVTHPDFAGHERVTRGRRGPKT